MAGSMRTPELQDRPRVRAHVGAAFVLLCFCGLVCILPSGCGGRKNVQNRLEKAVVRGNKPEVTSILDRYPQMVHSRVTDVMCNEGMLHLAVNNKQHAIADLLIARGIDVNDRDFGGATPLFAAVELGDSRMVRALLAHGARVRVRDEIGLTPLHVAATLDNEDIVSMLLNAGADPRARADDGSTPTDEALRNGRSRNVKLLKSSP